MAVMRCGTFWKLPRWIRLSVRFRNQRSARFSHELEVGMKCRWKRGWRFDYLVDVFTRLPTMKASQIEEMMPFRWAAARKKQAETAAPVA